MLRRRVPWQTASMWSCWSGPAHRADGLGVSMSQGCSNVDGSDFCAPMHPGIFRFAETETLGFGDNRKYSRKEMHYMTSESGAYNDAWFEKRADEAEMSARSVVPLLYSLVQPTSVLDIGCGDGVWLRSFVDMGVADVLGVDGWVGNPKLLRIPASQYLQADLCKPLNPTRTFDLAICLEVAEHLPHAAAPTLITSLCAAAPVVVFGAAIPGQEGTGHVNEQWPDYWAALFRSHGYLPFDFIRFKIWNSSGCSWWYAQNTLLYTSEGNAIRLAQHVDMPNSYPPIRMVHPQLYERYVTPTEYSPRQLLAMLPPSILRSLRRKLARRVNRT